MTKIAIIGTGGMAHSHADAYQKIKDCTLVAACDVDIDKATAFAQKYNIPHVFTDVASLLKTVDFDAVSIVTPDSLHKPIAIQALQAGKHVLCEKPLAMNHADTLEMCQVAKETAKINMVNLSFREAAAMEKAKELIDAGAIGRIMYFEAKYLQSWLVGNKWGDWRTTHAFLWRLSKNYQSQGALGDIGVHILDFATYPMGKIKEVRCQVETFKKNPEKVGDYDLEANDTALIQAKLENGAFGTVQVTRWATGYQNTLSLAIHGDKGAIRMDIEADPNTIEVCLGEHVHTCTWEKITVEPLLTNYERFVKSIETGKNAHPNFEDGANVQRVLDACFQSSETQKAVTL